MPSIISRSALETLFECEQKRYFNYDYQGQGIVSSKALFDTDLGIALHDSLYESFLSEGEYKYQDKAELSKEDNVLISGLTLTYQREILPTLLDQYDVVSLEQEWTVPIPDTDMHLALRMDAILRHKATGQLEIIDYKTKKGLGWVKDSQFKFNLQTALYTWALEQHTQEEIRGITYIVFSKGDVTVDKSKTFDGRIRNSPYCYGFKSEHGAYQVKWAKGWQKFQTWSQFDSDTWVNKVMDEDDRRSTFLVLPELKLDKSVRDVMIRNAVKYESWYRGQQESNLTRNHQACNKYGDDYRCPYFSQCWYNTEPSKEEFTERVDHHGDTNE